jgi:hypothetical protein
VVLVLGFCSGPCVFCSISCLLLSGFGCGSPTEPQPVPPLPPPLGGTIRFLALGDSTHHRPRRAGRDRWARRLGQN